VEPILVPAPPKSAFNKNRPVSDLLAGQLKHFQHVEHKHGIAIDRASSADLHTEAGAASYILKMTQAIRSQSRSKSSGTAIVSSVTKSNRKRVRTGGLSLAAASQPSFSPVSTKMGKKKKKKSEQRKKS
jgi:hypothetical protein